MPEQGATSLNGRSGVYEILNTVNNNRYIGSSVNLRKRRNAHFNMLRKGVHDNPYLQSAYNKYGHHAFVFNVLEYCYRDNVVPVEQYYIDTHKPEYNISPTAGSPAGRKLLPETKSRLRQAHLGKKRSPNHIMNSIGGDNPNSKPILQIDINTGEVIFVYSCAYDAQEQTQIKANTIRHAANGIKNTGGGFYWCYAEDYDSFNIEDRKNGRYRAVQKLDKKTGKVVAEYPSIAEAARSVDRDQSCISKCLRGSIKSSAGYKWKYVD